MTNEQPLKIFFSYSHRDEDLRKELDTHLSGLRRQGLITPWHDRKIEAGMEWANEIDTHLNTADIILLLVSSDFMGSEYCYGIELERAMERHEAGEACVVPVILRSVDWSGSPFSKLQAFPKDARPIMSSFWPNADEAFFNVTQGIRIAAESLIAARRQKAEQKQASEARYLKKVEEVLSDGIISDIERDTLDELRDELGLSPKETEEIETRAYEPYRKYQENQKKYIKTLTKLIEKGDYPFSEQIKRDLEFRQRDLGLKTEDVQRIEGTILAEAEAKYQEKLQTEAAERQRQLELETETQRQLEQQQQQEREEYQSRLQRYEEELTKAVQGVYPLSESALDGLQAFQQSLQLKAEDVQRIEGTILAEAEAKYQEKLQVEAAERQRQLELEEEAQRQLEQQQLQEREEYQSRLRYYEQGFTKAVQGEYPLSETALNELQAFQQSLQLKAEDIERIEQPILAEAEAKYQLQLQAETTEKHPKVESVSQKAEPLENFTEVFILKGHSIDVSSVAFSPDGKIIASGSRDNTIKLWDVEQKQEIRTLSGHSNWVQSVAFSLDGEILASGSADKTIKLWNWKTGQEVRTLTGHTGAVTSIAFSPNDDALLASGSNDKTVKLWNWKAGQENCTLSGHTNDVRSVAFSPDGQTLASLDLLRYVKLWALSTRKVFLDFKSSESEVSREMAISPNGQTIAVGLANGNVDLWDLPTGKLRLTISAHEVPWGFPDGVNSVAFSPNGQVLATASGDGKDKTIKLWDLATGEHLQTLSGHIRGVISIAFSPDGQTLVSGSYDTTVRIWY